MNNTIYPSTHTNKTSSRHVPLLIDKGIYIIVFNLCLLVVIFKYLRNFRLELIIYIYCWIDQ